MLHVSRLSREASFASPLRSQPPGFSHRLRERSDSTGERDGCVRDPGRSARELSHCARELSHCVRELSDCVRELSHCVHELSHCVHELSHCVHELSHCVRELSHCVRELSHCVRELSHCVRELSHCVRELSHCVRELSHCVRELSHCVRELSHCVRELSHCVRERSHRVRYPRARGQGILGRFVGAVRGMPSGTPRGRPARVCLPGFGEQPFGQASAHPGRPHGVPDGIPWTAPTKTGKILRRQVNAYGEWGVMTPGRRTLAGETNVRTAHPTLHYFEGWVAVSRCPIGPQPAISSPAR